MEQIRNRMNLQLVSNQKRLENLITKPTSLNRTVYGENICSVETQKDRMCFDKPIYIGFVVLEISKHYMYDFFYRVLKQDIYKDKKINLCYGFYVS